MKVKRGKYTDFGEEIRSMRNITNYPQRSGERPPGVNDKE